MILELSSGNSVVHLPSEPADFSCTVASADASIVAAGTSTGTVFLWNVSKRQIVACFPGQGDRVTSLSFSANGKKVVSGNSGGLVRVWNVTEKQNLQSFELEGRYRYIESVALSGDESRVVVVAAKRSKYDRISSDTKVFIMDVDSGAKVGEYRRIRKSAYIFRNEGACLSEHGDYVALQTLDEMLQVELSSGAVVRRVKGKGMLREIANGNMPRLRISNSKGDWVVLSNRDDELAWLPSKLRAHFPLKDGKTIVIKRDKYLEFLRLEND